MIATAPVLFFDSGVGGLSVVAPTRRLLPTAPFVYVADTAGFPYGTRSEADIAARVPALLGRLVERYRPRLVCIPCNTASVIALDAVRAGLDVPVVGTVPAIKPAAALSVTRVIGVLGTEATVRQPYVDRLVERHASDCAVLRLGSAELVVAAEAKLRGHPVDQPKVDRILRQLFDQPGGDRIDTIVLACTHFPLLAAEIAAAVPADVRLVDSGDGIARRVAALTEGEPWPDERPPGLVVVTRLDDDVRQLVPAFATYGFTEIATL